DKEDKGKELLAGIKRLTGVFHGHIDIVHVGYTKAYEGSIFTPAYMQKKGLGLLDKELHDPFVYPVSTADHFVLKRSASAFDHYKIVDDDDAMRLGDFAADKGWDTFIHA